MVIPFEDNVYWLTSSFPWKAKRYFVKCKEYNPTVSWSGLHKQKTPNGMSPTILYGSWVCKWQHKSTRVELDQMPCVSEYNGKKRVSCLVYSPQKQANLFPIPTNPKWDNGTARTQHRTLFSSFYPLCSNSLCSKQYQAETSGMWHSQVASQTTLIPLWSEPYIL